MSEQLEIRKGMVRYSGSAVLDFEDWHRLEDILDEYEHKLTRQEEVLQAVAKKPYKDSDPVSLLKTLREMAKEVLAEYAKSEEANG